MILFLLTVTMFLSTLTPKFYFALTVTSSFISGLIFVSSPFFFFLNNFSTSQMTLYDFMRGKWNEYQTLEGAFVLERTSLMYCNNSFAVCCMLGLYESEKIICVESQNCLPPLTQLRLLSRVLSLVTREKRPVPDSGSGSKLVQG